MKMLTFSPSSLLSFLLRVAEHSAMSVATRGGKRSSYSLRILSKI